MAEQKVLKRGWVKNAAIVFLIIMLLLTFFSNTIMNRSLPEVAVQYTESGTITAKIRGTGTATANKTYDVMINQTRKVEGVSIKVGDVVESGDVLFMLSDTESDELKAAQDALDDLKLTYRKAVISSSSGDYAKETRAIELAEKDLQDAIAERNSNTVSEAEYTNAKSEVASLKADVTSLTREVADLQEELTDLGGTVEDSQLRALERQIEDKKDEIEQAEIALGQAELVHGDNYNDLRTYAKEQYNKTDSTLEAHHLAAAAEELGEDDVRSIAYEAITKCENTKSILERELDRLEEDYNNLEDQDNSSQYNRVNKKLKATKEQLTGAQADLEDAESNLTDLTEKRTAYKAAVADVTQKQAAVDNLVFDLAEAKKTAGKDSALESVEMQAMRADIADKQEEVQELEADTVGATVTAGMAGIVKTINVEAGGTTDATQPLAVIEAPDMGYSLSFVATNEQSKKVKLGDNAEVTNYYWGSDVKAVLSQIKNDPENPGKGKLLVFTLSGEVESGAQLSLSLGEKSANYDVIVPNSALRSDSNGDFVLIVTAKNTPLGNRYKAERVDVKILATDDTNSAVSGGLTNYDYVITTSTKPIEPGMQVRLVEE